MPAAHEKYVVKDTRGPAANNVHPRRTKLEPRHWTEERVYGVADYGQDNANTPSPLTHVYHLGQTA